MRHVKVPPWFKDNGCSWAPDWLPSCGDIRQCCREHDWLYTLGGDDRDRLEADKHLFTCLLEKARQQGHRRRGRIVAHIYYFAVRGFGSRAFAYEHGMHRATWAEGLVGLYARRVLPVLSWGLRAARLVGGPPRASKPPSP